MPIEAFSNHFSFTLLAKMTGVRESTLTSNPAHQ